MHDDAGTGKGRLVNVLYLGLLLPPGLMLLLLAMERVERPLSRASVGDQLETFLDNASSEEVEVFVSEGYATALDRYWTRRRLGGLLPHRAR